MTTTIWFATTDGEDCPLHTTVHWTQAEAEDRVMRDLAEDCPETLRGTELVEMWELTNNGRCIIEAHEMPQPESSSAP